MKVSSIVNIFHSGVSVYLSTGWLLSSFHNQVLLGLIPTVYVNWLLDDNSCLLTKIENYFLKTESTVNISKDGFISKKLQLFNIHLDEKTIDQLLTMILFHSFLQCYKNTILL